eukprot:m.103268 g.103268  ORF g.103268 m.103268 type:complete len:1315 (-) comp9090_c0_seq3:1116-5060(-)
MTEFAISTFCFSCFQKKRTEQCPKCHQLSPSDRESVIAINWPTNSGYKWVVVRDPPKNKQPHYSICSQQQQCPHKKDCPRAHGFPPDAELVYWNIVAPKSSAPRSLDGLVTISTTQSATMSEVLTSLFSIEPGARFSAKLNELMANAIDSVPQLLPYLETLGWDANCSIFRPPVKDTSVLVQLLLDMTEGRDSIDEIRADVKALLKEKGPILGHRLLSDFYRKFKKTLIVRDLDMNHDRMRDLLWELNDVAVIDEDKKRFAVRLPSQKRYVFQRPMPASPKWSFRTPPDITARYVICNRWPNCRYGDSCHFAHGQPELHEWNERRYEKQRREKEKQQRHVTRDTRLFQQIRARLGHEGKELRMFQPTQTAISVTRIKSPFAPIIYSNRLTKVPINTTLHWTLRLSSEIQTALIRVSFLHPSNKAWKLHAVHMTEDVQDTIDLSQSEEEEFTLQAKFGGNVVDLDIDVGFEADAPGKHEQWLLLHFRSFVTSYLFSAEVAEGNAEEVQEEKLARLIDTFVEFLSTRPSPKETKEKLANLAMASAVVKSFHDGMSVLHWAVLNYCCPATVQVLIDAGADICEKDASGQLPLHIAASLGLIHHIKLLCPSSEMTNEKDARGFTPTHLAGINAWWPVLNELVQLGGEVDALDGDGTTILHRTIANNIINEAKWITMLPQKGNLQTKNVHGQTAAALAMDVGLSSFANVLQETACLPLFISKEAQAEISQRQQPPLPQPTASSVHNPSRRVPTIHKPPSINANPQSTSETPTSTPSTNIITKVDATTSLASFSPQTTSMGINLRQPSQQPWGSSHTLAHQHQSSQQQQGQQGQQQPLSDIFGNDPSHSLSNLFNHTTSSASQSLDHNDSQHQPLTSTASSSSDHLFNSPFSQAHQSHTNDHLGDLFGHHQGHQASQSQNAGMDLDMLGMLWSSQDMPDRTDNAVNIFDETTTASSSEYSLPNMSWGAVLTQGNMLSSDHQQLSSQHHQQTSQQLLHHQLGQQAPHQQHPPSQSSPPQHSQQSLQQSHSKLITYTPAEVFAAVASSSEDNLASMIEAAGLDVNAQEQVTGNTLMHIAIKEKNASAVKFLLSNPHVSFFIQNKKGNTCIHEAAAAGYADDTLANIIAKCSPNVYSTHNSEGYTPLHVAVVNNSIAFLKIFVSMVPQHVNVTTADGKTAAALAIENKKYEILNDLLNVPTYMVNKTDNAGNTLLHTAVLSHADRRAYELLLPRGLQLTVPNGEGKTPFDIAQTTNQTEIAQLMSYRIPRCASCGITGVSLLECSNCRSRLYCSQDCQVKDWNEKHSQECATLNQQAVWKHHH